MRRPEPVVCFVAASGQNVFFGELLDALRVELEATGVATRTAVDHFPVLEEDLVYVVVPHEYFALTQPSAHPDERQLRRTIALETEQPGTHWFERAVQVASRCAVTIDINHLGVFALRQFHIDARFLQFGYSAAWDMWGGDEAADRPVDVTFLGGYTPRRAAAIARCAGALASRRTALNLSETLLPHTGDSPQFVAGARKWRALARSKVMVNIHRSELGYFEWQRVIEAMANGCVVVSEHSRGCRPLVAGRHFVSTSAESLPTVLEALLADEERLARIRREAYELLTTRMRLADSIGVLREAVDDVLAATPFDAGAAPRGAPRPAPLRLDPPAIEYARLAETRDDLAVLRMGVKHLLLEQRQLRRELSRGGAEPAPVHERTSGPYERSSPRVSVIVSVYNYEHAVREALRSVAASDYRDFEVVVVDDGSHDGSSAAVRETLEALPWVPALQLIRERNEGLAAARNLAAERSRGELVFVLDADNAVYPHALGRLVEALDADPEAAFAYGILEKVVGGRSEDLVSWQAWAPERLRYGNFVDAMAMLRRDALLAAGGYTSDFRLYGWEDFALWCALVQSGRHGVRVPEVVARYVSALHSMISLTNVDAAEAYAVLARAYPFMGGDPLPGEAHA